MRRVVISGIGAITPVGDTFKESISNLYKGLSGLKPLKRPEVRGLPWTVAGQVNQEGLSKRINSRHRRRYGLFVQYALVSAEEALQDASLLPPPSYMMVFIGTSRGGILELERALKDNRITAHLMTATTHNMAAAQVAREYNLATEGITLSNACASGTVAFGMAYRAVASGVTDVAIVGGTEAPLTRLCLEGYGRMGALSKQSGPSASCPFDRNRDGFVLSEGACMIVLETLESASRRAVQPYAEVVGYSHLVNGSSDVRPSKDAEVAVIRASLKDACVSVEDIDFINTHGTSTPIGDYTEAEALKEVFGKRLSGVLTTANKSITGHMLSASGVFEIAVTAWSIRHSEVPPTINTRQPEFELNLSDRPVRAAIQYALSLSFGFGGENAAVVLKKVSLS